MKASELLSPVWAVRGAVPDPSHHVAHHHALHLEADGAAVDGLLLDQSSFMYGVCVGCGSSTFIKNASGMESNVERNVEESEYLSRVFASPQSRYWSRDPDSAPDTDDGLCGWIYTHIDPFESL